MSELAGVVKSLQRETLIGSNESAARAASLVDVIWFGNRKFMHAVMEVEHTTGVTPGLTRMKGLQDEIPSIMTRYIIVAPDEDRQKVIREANREQFHPLNIQFFPYSAVEELYQLCQRRKIRGTTPEFLDSFMESALQNI